MVLPLAYGKCPLPQAKDLTMVVLDLDGTLCNTHEAIRAALRAALGRDLACEEWTDYALAARYGITPAELHTILRLHEVLQNAAIEPGARDAILELRELGHPIGVVSGRGWHPDGIKLTRDWLSDQRLPLDFVQIVAARGSFRGRADPSAIEKCRAISMLTKGHGPIDAYVEDFVEHLGRAHVAGLVHTPVVFSRPWNAAAGPEPAFARVTSFAELPSLIGAPKAHARVVRHQ